MTERRSTFVVYFNFRLILESQIIINKSHLMINSKIRPYRLRGNRLNLSSSPLTSIQQTNYYYECIKLAIAKLQVLYLLTYISCMMNHFFDPIPFGLFSVFFVQFSFFYFFFFGKGENNIILSVGYYVCTYERYEVFWLAVIFKLKS